MSSKWKTPAGAPEVIFPEDFCRTYAGGINLSTYYRGIAQDPPLYPPPIKGIPAAAVQQWLAERGMAHAQRLASRDAQRVAGRRAKGKPRKPRKKAPVGTPDPAPGAP